jgi:cbb3-type cytochrome oxidase subunit 3
MEQKLIRNEVAYVAPTSRWIENGHIFLWLLKDTCWVTLWRPGGIFMIFPTLGVAFYILWRSRRHRAELFHNLAICLWITANSVWMVSEFLGVDKEYKKYSVVIFLIGILLLLVYYIFFFRKDRQNEKEVELAMSRS